MKERVAIIDLGTNTFHLLIADKIGPVPHILHREKQAVKIGLNGMNSGVITDAAVQRALTCLKAFNTTMAAHHVSRVQALGTSALRSASNGQLVLKRIREETGIDVKVISGDEEADYIYYGVRSAVDLGKEPCLIMDIGGGSTEYIIANEEKIFWKRSFDLGAQRLLERFQEHDPILPGEIKNLEAFLSQELKPLHDAMREFKPVTLIGSSGTFDTLSEIYCLDYSIDITAEGTETPLSITDYYEIHQMLISRNREQRMKIPGMIELRVDMIVVASCMIKYLLDKYPIEEIRVSTYSLKEGVLARM